MNAFTLVTLSISLIALSSLQADDDPLWSSTPPLEEDIDVITPAFSEEEIDQPLVINFKTLQVPVVEEEEALDMIFSEPEGTPHVLESPAIFPLENQEVALSTVSSAPRSLDEEAAIPAPLVPPPRVESSPSSSQIDMKEVFQGAPLIYSLLLAISIGTFGLWFYTFLNMRTEKLMPQGLVEAMQKNLLEGKTKEALDVCRGTPSLLSSMLCSGLLAYQTSPSEMMQSMQNEGKRVCSNLWQKLGLMNDVAIVAPMIGLLGTVVGMFYAFYDINRSLESMNALFDGLGISVGTTVAGLILAIFALGLHSASKYRLVKQLTKVESTAHQLIAKLRTDTRHEEQAT